MNRMNSTWIAAFALLSGCSKPLVLTAAWTVRRTAGCCVADAIVVAPGMHGGVCVQPCEPSGRCTGLGRTTSCRGSTRRKRCVLGRQSPGSALLGVLRSGAVRAASAASLRLRRAAASHPPRRRACRPCRQRRTPASQRRRQGAQARRRGRRSDGRHQPQRCWRGRVHVFMSTSASGGHSADRSSDADAGAVASDAVAMTRPLPARSAATRRVGTNQGLDLVAGCWSGSSAVTLRTQRHELHHGLHCRRELHTRHQLQPTMAAQLPLRIGGQPACGSATTPPTVAARCKSS